MSQTTLIPINSLPDAGPIQGTELVPLWQITLGDGTTVQTNVQSLVVGGSDGISLIANGNGALSIGNVASGTVSVNNVLTTLYNVLNGIAPFTIASGTVGNISDASVSPLGLGYTDTVAKFLGGQRAMVLAGGTTGDVTNTTVTVSGVAYTMQHIAALILSTE